MTFNKETQAIAELLKPQMVLTENGVVTLPKDAFASTLDGTDLTMDQFKAMQDHRDNVVAGTTLALGELGMDAMVADKSLNVISCETKVHKDTIGVIFNRSKTSPNPREKGATITKHGSVSSKYVANGAGNRGQQKHVRKHLNTLAEEMLAG